MTPRCLHTDDEYFLKSMREAIHEILTDVSDSFSNMIDMALANEIRVCTAATLYMTFAVIKFKVEISNS